MNWKLDSKRVGLLVVVTLGVLTLFGHLVTAALHNPGPADPPDIVNFAAPPGSAVAATARLDRTAVLEGSDGLVRMELILEGDQVEGVAAPSAPADLIVVLDRSGSMGGDKMEYALAAAAKLVETLEAQDRFALVTYANDAELAIPLADASLGAREGWLSRINAIRPGGGTNMSRGINRALETLKQKGQPGRSARIVLLSDGHANQGDSSQQGLTRRAALAARDEHVLTTVGIGQDFNETLMAAIADAGTGNYYYLRNHTELASVFSDEFTVSRLTVASGLSVTLNPRDGIRVVDAAGYPLETDDGKVTFRPGTLFSGQQRRVWITYKVPAHRTGDHSLGPVAVDWTAGGARQGIRLTDTPLVSCVRDETRFYESVNKEAWEAWVISEAYNEMRQRVADHVKKGDKDEALSAIQQYRESTGRMNEKIQSPKVMQNVEAQALEAEVQDAFTGAEQQMKQNDFSKSRQSEAYDGRRSGAKLH